MIQRIQTLYYILAILVLALPMAGMQLFSFINKEMIISITLFGNEKEEVAHVVREISIPQLPLFWGNLLLILLLLITIISFKNLKRQAALGRFTMIVYLLTVGGLLFAAYSLSQLLLGFQMSLSLGIGFYCMLSALLFIWLGNRGVKKDRKLLDSLNRLR
jgi:hypothetical protein